MNGERAITVMLVDNQPILLNGMRALVEAAEDLTLVGVETSVSKALDAVTGKDADVIVLNTSLPDMEGFSPIPRFASDEPSKSVVLLSEIEDRPYVERALQAGARAYVLKRSPGECLLHGIRAAGSGGVYLDPAVAATFLANGKQNGRCGGQREPQLAPREAEVLRLIALGYSTKEIAAQLAITGKSVETYKARGCEKLQLTTRAHIVRFAAANGWLGKL